jgi:hypothetical protein
MYNLSKGKGKKGNDDKPEQNSQYSTGEAAKSNLCRSNP